MRTRTAGQPSSSPFRAAVYLVRAVVALGLALVRRWPASFDDGATRQHRRHAGGGPAPMSAVNVLGIAGSIIMLVSLFEMLRRHRLREKYAVIWFVIAIVRLHRRARSRRCSQRATTALGLQVPANLLFFVASLVLLMLTLQHSYELGRLEERTRTLAEEVALLRLELDRRSSADTAADQRAAAPSPTRG